MSSPAASATASCARTRHEGRSCLYRFDAGPHDFSGLFPGGPLTRTLERLGVADAIEWRRLDHSYRLGGEPIEPARDWREYARQLGERFPEDAAGLASRYSKTFAPSTTASIPPARRAAAFPAMPGSSTRCSPSRAGIRSPCNGWIRPFDELVARHVIEPRKREGHRRADRLHQRRPRDAHLRADGSDVRLLFPWRLLSRRRLGPRRRRSGRRDRGARRRGAPEIARRRHPRRERPRRRRAARRRNSGERARGGHQRRRQAHLRRTRRTRSSCPPISASASPPPHPAPPAFMVHLGVDYVPEGRPALHIKDGAVGSASRSCPRSIRRRPRRDMRRSASSSSHPRRGARMVPRDAERGLEGLALLRRL